MVTIPEYQDSIWELFKPEIRNDPAKAELYLASKLSNEIGEVWEIALNYSLDAGTPEEIANADQTAIGKTIDELGDVLWYLFNLAKLKGVDVTKIESADVSLGTGHLQIALTVSSSKILGMILKKQYHNKPITDDQIIAELSKAISYMYAFVRDPQLNTSLEAVMQSNLDKLFNRHKGQKYDPNFYKAAN